MSAKDSKTGVRFDYLSNAISQKKGELLSLLSSKRSLIDGEVLEKSMELDRLLVKYMKER